jgi:hypothetical protein
MQASSARRCPWVLVWPLRRSISRRDRRALTRSSVSSCLPRSPNSPPHSRTHSLTHSLAQSLTRTLTDALSPVHFAKQCLLSPRALATRAPSFAARCTLQWSWLHPQSLCVRCHRPMNISIAMYGDGAANQGQVRVVAHRCRCSALHAACSRASHHRAACRSGRP